MRADKLREKLVNGDFNQVSRAVMSVADGLQAYEPSIQLAALAFCFLTYSRLTGQNIQDTYTAVNSIAIDAECLKPEFKAAEEYLRKEVLKI